MFLGSKVRRVRMADNLTAIYEPGYRDRTGFLSFVFNEIQHKLPV
jgi:hypothetical protein